MTGKSTSLAAAGKVICQLQSDVICVHPPDTVQAAAPCLEPDEGTQWVFQFGENPTESVVLACHLGQ